MRLSKLIKLTIMKLNKFLQNCFKKVFQFIFKLFYGEIKLKLDLNNLNNLEKKIIPNLQTDLPEKKNYYTYKIKNGRIYTDYNENVAIISENMLLGQISYQQVSGNLLDASYNVVLKKGTPRKKKNYKGKMLSVVQGASGNNYSHWILEILPKLKMYSENYRLDDLDYFYVPSINSFQSETLNFLGISKDKLIDSKKFRHVQAEELFIVDHPYYYEGTILEQNKNLPKWIIPWLRNVFLNCEKKFNANKKVFIDRTDSSYNHNQIINNEEVFDYLNKKGFTYYKLKDLTFFEKVYLFKNAECILGVHGAGFANLVFCKSKTNVLEIRPYSYSNEIYKKISEINCLNYHLLETQSVEKKRDSDGDINLSIDEVDSILKKFI